MNKTHLKSANLLEGNIPILVSMMHSQTDTELHDHDFLELAVIYAGSGVHYTYDDEYEIHAGDVFVIQPGMPHGYSKTRGLSLCNIIVDENWFVRLMSNVIKSPGFYAFFEFEPQYRRYHQFKSRLTLTVHQLNGFMSIVDRLKKYTSPQLADWMSATGILLEMVGFLSSHYTGDAPQPAMLLKLGNVIRHIESNFAQPITLDELADEASMSSRSLLRLFRNLTEKTPIDYLIKFRLNQACRMLETTDENITTIAFKCGFADSNYFSRQFRKFKGITPREYRALATMEKARWEK